jgi:hypothetical protein
MTCLIGNPLHGYVLCQLHSVAPDWFTSLLCYTADRLISLSEDVVRACRNSLGEAWDFEKDLIPSHPLKSKNAHIEDRKAQK